MVFLNTTELEGVVALFDPTAQYVAVINKVEGSIRVFDATSGKLHANVTKKVGALSQEFVSHLCSACWSLQVNVRSKTACAPSTSSQAQTTAPHCGLYQSCCRA
jgi:hypothetical protein